MPSHGVRDDHQLLCKEKGKIGRVGEIEGDEFLRENRKEKLEVMDVRDGKVFDAMHGGVLKGILGRELTDSFGV